MFIADGPNAGRSTRTDAAGNYSLAELLQSGFTVNMSASNYLSQSKGVTLTSDQTLSFQLIPQPRALGNVVRVVADPELELHRLANVVGKAVGTDVCHQWLKRLTVGEVGALGLALAQPEIPVAALVVRAARAPLQQNNRAFREEVEQVSTKVGEMIRLIPLTRAHGVN